MRSYAVRDARRIHCGQSVTSGAGLTVLHRSSTANPVVFVMSISCGIAVLSALQVITFLVVQWQTNRRTPAHPHHGRVNARVAHLPLTLLAFLVTTQFG